METIDLLKERLTTILTPTHLALIDESQQHAGHQGAREGAGHFRVTIVSPQFAELTLIQRHRLVYSAVDDLMNTTIHALSIQAYTPEEFSS